MLCREKLILPAERVHSSAFSVGCSRRVVDFKVWRTDSRKPGQAGAFSSWVGMGDNQSISADQIQSVLGSEQVNALAAKFGVDPAQASHFLAEYLPKVVDKLTPEGKVDPTADHQQGLADLVPALLQSLRGRA